MQKRSSPIRSATNSPTHQRRTSDITPGSYSTAHVRNLSHQGYPSANPLKQSIVRSDSKPPAPERKEYPRLTMSSRKNSEKGLNDKEDILITTGRFKDPDSQEQKPPQNKSTEMHSQDTTIPTEQENRRIMKLDLEKIAASVSNRIEKMTKNHSSPEEIATVETEKTPSKSDRKQPSLISVSSDSKNLGSKDSGSSTIRRKEFNALSQKLEEDKEKAKEQIEQLRNFQSEIKGMVQNIHPLKKTPPLPVNSKPPASSSANISHRESPNKPILRDKQQMSIDSRNSPQRVSYKEQEKATTEMYRRKIFNSLSQNDLDSLNLQNNLDIEGSTELRQKLMNSSGAQKLSTVLESRESIRSTGKLNQSLDRVNYEPNNIYYSPQDDEYRPRERPSEYSGEKQISGVGLRASNLDVSNTSIRRSIREDIDRQERSKSILKNSERKDKFIPLATWIKEQVQGNSDIEEALELLMELHETELKISDNHLKTLRTKYDHLYENNKKLISTLQICEKEIDSLTTTSTRMNNLITHYEARIKELEQENEEFIRLLEEQKLRHQAEQAKLNEDCERKIYKINHEIELIHDRYKSMRKYTQYCESTIAAINVTLRKLMAKASYKVANPRLAATLESIIQQTEAFVDDSIAYTSSEIEQPTPPHRRTRSTNTSYRNPSTPPKKELLQKLLGSPKEVLFDKVKKNNRELILSELVSASSKLNRFLKENKSPTKKKVTFANKYKSANNSPAPSRRNMSTILEEDHKRGGGRRSLNLSMDNHRSLSPVDSRLFDDISYHEYLENLRLWRSGKVRFDRDELL